MMFECYYRWDERGWWGDEVRNRRGRKKHLLHNVIEYFIFTTNNIIVILYKLGYTVIP